MPVSPIIHPPSRTSSLSKLILLTAAVVASHALALGSMPSSVRPLADSASDPQPLSLIVLTRPIAPVLSPASTVPAPLPAKSRKTPAPSAVPKVAAQKPAATGAAPPNVQANSTMEVAAVTPAAVPVLLAALDAKVAPKDAVVSEAKPSATTPTAPSAPVTSVPRVQKLAFAPPVLLVYEGRGEERGFIKYSASGELLWAPEGSRYNAHLEISALGFRVRTWSSKGDLTDGGLQPLRFGDKPRGAELATHFQREKGIISFSANNPDVPLQMGAQDKLSAILQLSAIVAGEPQRYANGATITFQAADAHRAELWNFKVGAMESLDLPGGVVAAIKLSKEPTVDFDQRIEVWLAPDLRYMPVRIRITEANGAFADLLWRKTQKPE